MAKHLLSKAWRINPAHEVLVNYAADQEGGEQVGKTELGDPLPPGEVPFGLLAPPLADRKYLVMTIPLDSVMFGGDSNVTGGTGYIRRGRASGSLPAPFAGPPVVEDYSNRKQFLRGQYLSMALLDAVPVFAQSGSSFEVAFSLELA